MRTLPTAPMAPRRRLHRAGYTLVELLISLPAAVLLMTGLVSAIAISATALEGNTQTHSRSRAAQVQQDMLSDLRHATSFTTRTATATTFQVPDRNNDQTPETISYSWTGLPAAELQYSYNGGPATVVLNDVQAFDLAYLSRTMNAQTTLPPVLNPGEWGNRWATSDSRFGYETIYTIPNNDSGMIWGSRATLTEAGILQSISAYVFIGIPGDKIDITLAIYATNQNGNPTSLIASAPVDTVSTTGWLTMDLPAIPVAAGDYVLAWSTKKSEVAILRSLGPGHSVRRNLDAAKNGWPSDWGTIHENASYNFSIYATYLPN